MIWLAMAIGLVTGIISGFGVGGGSLLMLYLTAILGMEPFAAGGINLLYFLGCAPSALWFHARHKRVEWQAAVWAGVGGVVTAGVCAFIASNTASSLLRQLFGALLLGVGLKELWACRRLFSHQKSQKAVG